MLNPLIERLVAENAALKAEVEALREDKARSETVADDDVREELKRQQCAALERQRCTAMAAEKAVETPIPKLIETDSVGL